MFECVPIGQPTPAYFWSKEGQQVRGEGKLYFFGKHFTQGWLMTSAVN